MSADENKPTKRSGQRKGKTEPEGKKAESRKRKSAQRQAPLPDQSPETTETIAAEVTAIQHASIDASPAEDSPERTSAQPQDLLPDQLPETTETIAAEVTAAENASIDTSPAEDFPVQRVASAEADTVNYQAIANAYRKYAKESLDQTQSFFERLSGVRSLDKAFELQTEFAKQAYDGFVAESQKIRELHSQLAMQRLKHWEGLVNRMIKPL